MISDNRSRTRNVLRRWPVFRSSRPFVGGRGKNSFCFQRGRPGKRLGEDPPSFLATGFLAFCCLKCFCAAPTARRTARTIVVSASLRTGRCRVDRRSNARFGEINDQQQATWRKTLEVSGRSLLLSSDAANSREATARRDNSVVQVPRQSSSAWRDHRPGCAASGARGRARDVQPGTGFDARTVAFLSHLLADAYIREETIADLTGRIGAALFDAIRPIENWGLRPYFNFRSKSEQDRRRDPDWV